MNQKHCRGCPHLDFSEMSDEMYCKLKDYELIRLRWHKLDEWNDLVNVLIDLPYVKDIGDLNEKTEAICD